MDIELPPCFAAWCDCCGWKGLAQWAHVYVVGAAYLTIEDCVSFQCPTCKRQPHRRCDLESLTQRHRWHAAHFTQKDPGRPSDRFRCTCTHTPPLDVVDVVEVRLGILGGCFRADHELVRISGRCKCRGCYAETVLGLVEFHNYRDAEVWDASRNRHVPAWELTPSA